MRYIKAIRRATPHYIFHRAIIKVTDIISNILPKSIKGWKVDRRKLAKILVKATISTGYPARIGENAGIADQDSISYQLRKISLEDCLKLNQIIGMTALKLIKGSKSCIALIDTSEIEFYGRRDADVYYSPARKRYVLRYMVLSIIAHNRVIPISIRPITRGVFPENIVETLVEDAHMLGLNIRLVMLDRGFHTNAVVRKLVELNTPFIIGAKKTRRIKRILKGLKHGFHVIPLNIDGINVSLIARWVDGEWYTYLCWMLNSRIAYFYYKRWGIESCIRMFKLFHAKTCARSHVLRYLFLLISVLLYIMYLLLLAFDVIWSYMDFIGVLAQLFAEIFLPVIRARIA